MMGGYKVKEDGLVKSLKRLFSVIPTQAGIQYFHLVRILWIPVFTGMTTFYDSIKNGILKKLFLPLRKSHSYFFQLKQKDLRRENKEIGVAVGYPEDKGGEG